MERHFTIHVRALNEHGVLQRILLAFSRRRLRLQALQLFDVAPDRPADIQLDLDCGDAHAREVIAQLRGIVEVRDVWAEETPIARPSSASTECAAA